MSSSHLCPTCGATLHPPAPLMSEEVADVLKAMARAAVCSGSAFNQGVVRGLEIAAAQFEYGHISAAISTERNGE